MKSSDIVALDVTNGAGALVYWRLDGNLDPAELALPWARAGLDEKFLPATPAPSTALSRAMRELSARRSMVRPLDQRGAHALVHERAEGDELTYSVALRSHLDPAGRPVFDPADHPLAGRLRVDYEYQLTVCSSEDVASWLVRLARRLDGLALRDTGGFYYLPPDRIEEWAKATRALRAVSSHQTFMIPAMRSVDAVSAILDALENEAQAEAETMESELLAGINGKSLGERALTGRVARCESMERKVSRYEGLLGTKLDALRGRLESLRANLAAAALAAMGDAAE